MSKTPFKILALSAIFALMFLTSCYPGDEVEYKDLDLVATVYDKSANFQEFTTFVMPDTIVHIKDTLSNNNNVELSHDYDFFILEKIKDNMLSFGFVVETDPENNPPDAIVTVSAMASTKYYAWNNYPYYWDWYWGWGWYYKNSENSNYYDPWYPYYPWYETTYVSSYSSGTMLISMNDFRNVDSEPDTVPVVWLGAINGLLGSKNKTDIQNRLEYGINQAFEQSPYLKQN